MTAALVDIPRPGHDTDPAAGTDTGTDSGLPLAHWDAALELRLAVSGDRTRLVRRRHHGPLRVQKPFYPGDGACHVYVLHPPGGIAGGDRLSVDVEAGDGAAVLVTTPAAAKVYRSAGPPSTIGQRLSVAADATLEWLPQDTILFGGSRCRQRTVVELDRRSRYFGWEIVSLGRPASGDRYATGTFDQSLDVVIDGTPALIERLRWDDADRLLTAAWGLAGRRVLATALVYPADNGALTRSRRLLAWLRLPEAAATLIDRLLVVRAVGDDAVAVQHAFRRLWAGLRAATVGLEPAMPRIWAT